MKRLLKQLLCGLLLLLIAPNLAWAQTGTVEGTVIDGETGDALPGVNVIVQGSQLGAATNIDGEYSISDIEPGIHIIEASFVGYQLGSREVTVEPGETVEIDIALQPDIAALDEVVVTSIAGSVRRAQSAVSVGRVDAEELSEMSDYSSINELVAGNVPGVNVSTSSGNVGAGIRFRIRGGVSLNGDGQPVIYVDGVRVDQNEIVGFGAGGQGTSALSDLNPEDIASIEFLKGSASTAIYGTDGAEGVVLITTKSGLAGQDLRVRYDGTFGYSERVREYSDDDYISADAANALFRRGDLRQHRVSASGSYSGLSYFASVTNRRDRGILHNNSGERTSFRANFELAPTDELLLRANSGFTINQIQRPDNDNNIFGQLGNALLAPGGQPYFFTDSLSVFLLDDQQQAERFVGSLSASYSPTFLAGFEISATAGLDASNRRQDRTFPFEGTYTGVTDGERNIYQRTNRQWNADISARYYYQITDDLSAGSVVGGQAFATYRRTADLTVQEFSTGLITDVGGGSAIQDVGESFLNQRRGGFFAQQEFDYKETYHLVASVRRDYATQLGEEVGSASIIYPSIRGSMRLDQFDFVPESFGLFKLRAAWGQSGVLPDLEDSELLRYQAEASGFGAGATINSVGDPALEPERVSEVEAGVDIDYMDRVSLMASYFYQYTSQSIVDFAPAPSTGYGGFEVPRNVGRIVGQGVEVGLGITPYRSLRHQVNLQLNYAYQKAKVKELGGTSLPGGFDLNYIVEGLEPYAFYTIGVLGAQFDENGEYAGPRTTDGQVYVGAPRPDHFGGARLNVTLFNNLNITTLAEFAAGQQVFNNTKSFAVDFGNSTDAARLQGRLGFTDNPDYPAFEPGTDEYRRAADEYARLSTAYNANFIEDADWMKLREVSVRYNFVDVVQRLGMASTIRHFTLGFSGRNLLTFTNYSGPDPEVNFDGSRGRIQGQDFLTLQNPRTFTVTLSVGV